MFIGCLVVSLVLCGQSDCIDLRDLNAPYVHCTWGTVEDPYLHQGVGEWHHTVITDPWATDMEYLTNNQLLMVPPGETYSILLGNWAGGCGAESISVDIEVDTNQFDLLILMYAAVMDNPVNHHPWQQPKFTFDILDMQGQPIDTACLSAVFVSDINLGWNHNAVYTLFWKDWTKVGVNITDYHGQTIQIRLTTYDCTLGDHYAHAYFLLSCGNKHIDHFGCGDTQTYTFSAPDGFNYRWYWHDTPSQTLSTEQTVNLPSSTSGVLHCYVSFIDNDICGFDMSIDLGTILTEPRYPVAEFSTEVRDCLHKIRFVNESFTSSDGVHPDGTGNHSDDTFWDFGDGQTSTSISPIHTYITPGDFTVMMVAGLGDFQCTDTVYHTVHIPEDTRVDTIVCDAFMWDDIVYTESGVYSHGYVTEGGCDSLVAVHLTVINSDGYEVDTMACDRYVWNDSEYLLSGSYTQAFPAADKCDSIVTVHLDLNYTPIFDIQGAHYVIGGSEWEFSEYPYSIVLDQPMCRIDSVTWSVDCPNMSVLPSADGKRARLRVFTFLAPNDSVALNVAVHNRCGTVEKTLWIHTTYYDVGEQSDGIHSLKVFPNPSPGLFTVETKGFLGYVSLMVYDSEGTKVMAWEENLLSDDVRRTVDCSSLCDGIYVLRVKKGTAAVSKKFIVRK